MNSSFSCECTCGGASAHGCWVTVSALCDLTITIRQSYKFKMQSPCKQPAGPCWSIITAFVPPRLWRSLTDGEGQLHYDDDDDDDEAAADQQVPALLKYSLITCRGLSHGWVSVVCKARLFSLSRRGHEPRLRFTAESSSAGGGPWRGTLTGFCPFHN